MKEDFLHYLWKIKIFDTSNLTTSSGEKLTIENSGSYLQLAGPDFFNSHITISDQKWAGNVEIHLKSSDWYAHHHERDPNYDSVILHVVWDHDVEIYRQNNTEIPVLILKNLVSKETLDNYHSLVLPKSWIYCEKQIKFVNSFIMLNWQERLFFERLERKSKPVFDLAESTLHDWDTILFCQLAKNFGLNTNGDSFYNMANSIPFSVIRKEGNDLFNLESLFFGVSGLLNTNKEDSYYKKLKTNFDYLVHKYQLQSNSFTPLQFFKHRPDNFPTIRISQLANVYCGQSQLFSKIIKADNAVAIYEIFDKSVSEYWETHYQFDKISPKKKKPLSKSFIDLLIINTIIPIQFAYAKSQGKEIAEKLIALLIQVKPEANAIIDKFSSFGLKANNAFETQALLQLKNEYCNKNRCLECAIGMELLKSEV
jgi:hypothetical protein